VVQPSSRHSRGSAISQLGHANSIILDDFAAALPGNLFCFGWTAASPQGSYRRVTRDRNLGCDVLTQPLLDIFHTPK
jgi:hypothetical protein